MAKNNNTYTDLGKVPPQAIDVEEAVLGAILVEGNCFQNVIEYLKSETFYKDSHQKIFTAFSNLFENKKPIDLLTVTQELRDINRLEEVGGAVYLAQLSSKIGSASHIEFHSKILSEKYIRRELIRLSIELNQSMYDEDADILSSINSFDASKMDILSFTKDEEMHIRDAVKETIEHSYKLNKKMIPLGIPTGFKYFDEFSGGIQRGDLIVIGGEPSNGKTTLALDMLENTTSNFGTKGAIFSYEMTTFQLTARLIGRSQRISSKDLIRGAIDSEYLTEIHRNCHKLRNSELYIVKPSGSGFIKLKRDIVRMVKLYGIELIVIDYLQLVSNAKQGSSNAENVGEMANSLKSLAVELNIGIILISQLARDKANPRPAINRLKYSGDIEGAADTILLTFLPFKYGLNFENVNGESIEIGENGIIIIGKGRNIGTCDFILDFKKEIPAFFNFHQEDVRISTIESNRQFEPKDVTPF